MRLAFPGSKRPGTAGLPPAGSSVGFGAVAAAAAFAFAVHKAARLRLPVGLSHFQSEIAEDGTVPEFESLLQHISDKGLEPDARPEVWPLLLGVYSADDTHEQRLSVNMELRAAFEALLERSKELEAACLEATVSCCRSRSAGPFYNRGEIAIQQQTPSTTTSPAVSLLNKSPTAVISGGESLSARCVCAAAAAAQTGDSSDDSRCDRYSMATPLQSKDTSTAHQDNNCRQPAMVSTRAGAEWELERVGELGLGHGDTGVCPPAFAASLLGHVSRTDLPPELQPYWDSQQSIALDAVRVDFKKSQLPRAIHMADPRSSNAKGGGASRSCSTRVACRSMSWRTLGLANLRASGSDALAALAAGSSASLLTPTASVPSLDGPAIDGGCSGVGGGVNSISSSSGGGRIASWLKEKVDECQALLAARQQPVLSTQNQLSLESELEPEKIDKEDDQEPPHEKTTQWAFRLLGAMEEQGALQHGAEGGRSTTLPLRSPHEQQEDQDCDSAGCPLTGSCSPLLSLAADQTPLPVHPSGAKPPSPFAVAAAATGSIACNCHDALSAPTHRSVKASFETPRPAAPVTSPGATTVRSVTDVRDDLRAGGATWCGSAPRVSSSGVGSSGSGAQRLSARWAFNFPFTMHIQLLASSVSGLSPLSTPAVKAASCPTSPALQDDGSVREHDHGRRQRETRRPSQELCCSLSLTASQTASCSNATTRHASEEGDNQRSVDKAGDDDAVVATAAVVAADASDFKCVSALARFHLDHASHFSPDQVRLVERLISVLSAYSAHDPHLGYCQGMSDLALPFVLLLEEDFMAFWCFVRFMDRVRANFVPRPDGVFEPLATLGSLVATLDPALGAHLAALGADSCHFAHRMVTAQMRRELPADVVVRLWEQLWADDKLEELAAAQQRWRPLGEQAWRLEERGFPRAEEAVSALTTGQRGLQHPSCRGLGRQQKGESSRSSECGCGLGMAWTPRETSEVLVQEDKGEMAARDAARTEGCALAEWEKERGRAAGAPLDDGVGSFSTMGGSAARAKLVCRAACGNAVSAKVECVAPLGAPSNVDVALETAASEATLSFSDSVADSVTAAAAEDIAGLSLGSLHAVGMSGCGLMKPISAVAKCSEAAVGCVSAPGQDAQVLDSALSCPGAVLGSLVTVCAPEVRQDSCICSGDAARASVPKFPAIAVACADALGLADRSRQPVLTPRAGGANKVRASTLGTSTAAEWREANSTSNHAAEPSPAFGRQLFLYFVAAVVLSQRRRLLDCNELDDVLRLFQSLPPLSRNDVTDALRRARESRVKVAPRAPPPTHMRLEGREGVSVSATIASPVSSTTAIPLMNSGKAPVAAAVVTGTATVATVAVVATTATAAAITAAAAQLSSERVRRLMTFRSSRPVAKL